MNRNVTEFPPRKQMADEAGAIPSANPAANGKHPPIGNCGRARVVIERVEPEIDAGRFPIKRIVGESVVVGADVYADGHDAVVASVRYRFDGASPGSAEMSLPSDERGQREREGSDCGSESAAPNLWQEVAMTPLVNDHWQAEFPVDRVGTYRYTIVAWVDPFLTWQHDLKKRVAAGRVDRVDLAVGAELIEAAAEQAEGADRHRLGESAARLRHEDGPSHARQIAEDRELSALVRQHAARAFPTFYEHELQVTVDRQRAGFSAWYEMFPRSASDQPGRHGTFKDVEARLPYVASMGFDVLYLPPIHPIGRSFRKGKNNRAEATADDVGSPWGIGAEEGGHKSIHPELGTLADFRDLVAAAKGHGIEIALDIALQCSPDHPYVSDHPQWFRHRPDGSIQYAENPPKKYQDIFPLDFESEDWQALWIEAKSIFDFWIEQGVNIFRVDNPHTKPFRFWEWCIGEIKREHPAVLFLAEAFTRPKMMYQLAKSGFTQSYTYFAWRNTKAELTEYVRQLMESGLREFLRPNFWPNTPDILTEYLQVGGRAAFLSRLVLAATLSPNYGIYGPPFEHGWSAPREPGSEEYLDSEKYEIHHHDLQRPDSLKDFIACVNRLRREYPVLQTSAGLQFQEVDNDAILAFTKASDDRSEILLVMVNLDPHHRQSGWVRLPLEALGLDAVHPYQVHDLLSEARYLWNGPRNYVELDPQVVPAHIFRIRRRVRTERDFEYYL